MPDQRVPAERPGSLGETKERPPAGCEENFEKDFQLSGPQTGEGRESVSPSPGAGPKM
jgi:hypothetical protein